jgi:hypothetical protein
MLPIIIIIIIIIIIRYNELAQETKNVESKEDTDMTGNPISNRISTIHPYTTVKHNGNRAYNQRYTKSCHITRRFLNHEDHEVDSNIKEYEDA